MPIYHSLMANLLRVKARWSGFAGAPGYSIFHFGTGAVGDGGGALADNAAAATARGTVRRMFSFIMTEFPPVVSISIEQDVEVIDSTNGELVGALDGGVEDTFVGSGSPTYSAVSGAVLNWRTAGIRNGRRVRGRTFLVPLSSASYDAQGSLTVATRGLLAEFSQEMVTTTNPWEFGVFCRPSTPIATDGVFHVATSSNVPDLAAVLRSRRD